jgi:hypothetical protein
MYEKLISTDDEWRCFCCDPSEIRGLQKHHEELSKVLPALRSTRSSRAQRSLGCSLTPYLFLRLGRGRACFVARPSVEK